MSLLQFKTVTRQFGGLRAIDQVSFDVGAGETVGLIGPNGAGKTTLFSMASGFLPPSSGEIHFDGARVDGRPAPEVCRRGLVRTFQIVRPFGEMSVLDNVMIGSFLHHPDSRDARQAALAVLERFGMADRAAQPAKTLTLAGRKRLEIAKTIATRPKLLMLDEVMAGLNPVETDEVLDLIRGLRADGVSVLLVEHNMHAVMALSDRVVVIHHGRKICDAAPQAAANDPEVIAAYLGKDED